MCATRGSGLAGSDVPPLRPRTETTVGRSARTRAATTRILPTVARATGPRTSGSVTRVRIIRPGVAPAIRANATTRMATVIAAMMASWIPSGRARRRARWRSPRTAQSVISQEPAPSACPGRILVPAGTRPTIPRASGRAAPARRRRRPTALPARRLSCAPIRRVSVFAKGGLGPALSIARRAPRRPSTIARPVRRACPRGWTARSMASPACATTRTLRART